MYKFQAGLRLDKLPTVRMTLFWKLCNYKRWLPAANSHAVQA